MIEKFENWGDYELGRIASDFMNCGNCKSCENCFCNGVICNIGEHRNYVETRKAFIREFEKRMME